MPVSPSPLESSGILLSSRLRVHCPVITLGDVALQRLGPSLRRTDGRGDDERRTVAGLQEPRGLKPFGPGGRETLRASNRVATPEIAKTEFEASWKQWEAWAGMEEVE